MHLGTDLLTLNLKSKNAVNRIVKRLTKDGMQVIRSFDLQIARSAHVDCRCPQHGKSECDCQLVVLLVYDEWGTLLNVVAHGREDKTYFVLAQPPQGVNESRLKNKILQALAIEGFAAIRGNLK